MLSIDFTNEFVTLFRYFDTVALVCMMLGIVLVIVEFNVQGSNRFVVLGGLLLLTGFVVRLMQNGTMFMAFLMVLMIAIVIITAYLAVIMTSNRAWLIKASTLSINLEIADGLTSYAYLQGLEGETTTEINPHGHMIINDVNFYVTSVEGQHIPKGHIVKVVGVDNDKLFVQSIEQGLT